MVEEPGTGPRWLNEHEMTAYLRLLRLMTRVQGGLEDQLRRDAGLSHFEYAVMARLSGAADFTHRMSTLAQMANGSLSRLSHVVARLEKRGWIRRETDPLDGRFTNAILTPEGFAKVSASAAAHIDVVRSMVIDPLSTDQLGDLSTVCEAILDAVDPGGRDFDHQRRAMGSDDAASSYGDAAASGELE